MISFDVDLDNLTFSDIANIPVEVSDSMLGAAAKIVTAALKLSITTFGLVDTGELMSSLKTVIKKDRLYQKNEFLIYPYGRRKGSVDGGTRATYYRKKTRSGVRGRALPTKNNDIGFIHEFGAPHKGIASKQWMRFAIEACADEAMAAEEKILYQWLENNF